MNLGEFESPQFPNGEDEADLTIAVRQFDNAEAAYFDGVESWFNHPTARYEWTMEQCYDDAIDAYEELISVILEDEELSDTDRATQVATVTVEASTRRLKRFLEISPTTEIEREIDRDALAKKIEKSFINEEHELYDILEALTETYRTDALSDHHALRRMVKKTCKIRVIDAFNNFYYSQRRDEATQHALETGKIAVGVAIGGFILRHL